MCSYGKLISCIFIGFICSSSGFTLPKYVSTKLPFPEKLDVEEKMQYLAVLNLDVYQDSEDPNQYYYFPPFHVRQYSEGAARMVLNTHSMKQFGLGTKVMETRNDFGIEKLAEKKAEITAIEVKRESLVTRLIDAYTTANERLIKFLESEVLKKESEISKLRLEMENTEIALLRQADEQASLYFSQAGLLTDISEIDNSKKRLEVLKSAAKEIGQSYGGFLSVNAYAGFTEEQLNALQSYREKYFPHLKVSLLPVEELKFFALTELVNKDDIAGTAMFKSISGAGDYLGTTIVFDASIVGSMGLARNLSPFVLPVGIKAVFKRQLLPAEAELDCDFSSGFTVKGRADIKDGLVIYDNDIENHIKDNDSSVGACNLKYIKGDPKSAYFKSLQDLEIEFEKMRVNRAYLSYADRKNYFNSVMSDLANNRRQEEPKYTNIMKQFTSLGWETLVIDGLTRAADFHWHTNIQDVASISSVKFKKRVVVEGHETAEKHMPINLCLVFNAEIKAYDACTEEEKTSSKDIVASSVDALKSKPCVDTADPAECGKKRAEDGYTAKRAVKPVENTRLVNSI